MKIVIMLMFSLSIAFTLTLDEQIKLLEHATPKERVELMNKIKEQLIEMNQNERMNTIEKLRAKMNPSKENGDTPEQTDGTTQEVSQHHRAEGNKGRHRPHKVTIKERVEQPNKNFERPRNNHLRVREEGKPPLPSSPPPPHRPPHQPIPPKG